MNGFDATINEFCSGIEELLAQDLFGAAVILDDCERFVRKPPDQAPNGDFDHQGEAD